MNEKQERKISSTEIMRITIEIEDGLFEKAQALARVELPRNTILNTLVR